MFLLLFLLNAFGPDGVKDYRMTPTVPLAALPFDPLRLAPWAADYSSRAVIPVGTACLPAPLAGDYTTHAPEPAQTDNGQVEELQQENAALRKRLDQLEQMMKDNLSQPPVAAPQPGQTVTNGQKTVPGWRAELYAWNSKGVLAADPYRTVLTQSCPFDGTFGHVGNSEMSIYRFLGVYRVKTQGRYVFAVDTTCGFGHQCHLSMAVDGGEILKFDGRTDYQRLQNGVPLTPGDHTLEFTIYLKSNNFLKYEPADRFKWYPLVKTADDLNARDFAPDELFSVVPASTTMSVAGCTR